MEPEKPDASEASPASAATRLKRGALGNTLVRLRQSLRGLSWNTVVYPFRVLWLALREFVRDGCAHKASALAFTTILTLVPILIVSFALFQAFGALKEVEARVQAFIFSHLIASSSQAISTYLTEFIHKTSAKTVGAVGVVALIGAAFALLNTVENVLGHIWNVRHTRRFGQRLSYYIAMILLGPLLIGVSISITAKFTHTDLFRTLMSYAFVGKAIYFMTPLVFSWLAFFLIYRFLTGVRVPLVPAALGAVIGGSLWELGKIGFDFYVLKLFAASKIYGSLVAFPIFLLWIYVSWFIILYGAELAYAIHHYEWLSSPLSRLLVPYPLMEQLAIRSVLKAAEAFEAGKTPLTPDVVAKDMGLERGLVEGVFEMLVEANILMRSHSDAEGYFLSRSIETIQVSEVVDTVRRSKQHAEHSLIPYTDGKVQELFLQMDRAYDEAIASTTLADLLAESPEAVAPATADDPTRSDGDAS
ncbi:MAG: YihY family inner membrane protein [Nitrospinae bacterium]|nr:YihY family inner membrane protein [Nitrospinota bacterium]